MSESTDVKTVLHLGRSATADLSGKTALVTGASHGIGRATALALAARGARVLAHYRSGAADAARVADAIARDGGRADLLHADLSAVDGPDSLAAAVRRVAGDRLDILIANAGLYKAASIEETTPADFDELFAVNVRAPFFLMQRLMAMMSTGSSIVLVSSLSADAAFGAIAAYAATKGAIDTLVKHFALALGRRGVRVNAVAPGLVMKDGEGASLAERRREQALGMQVMQRMAHANDIADVIAFLASDEARWITGQVVKVDGGSRL